MRHFTKYNCTDFVPNFFEEVFRCFIVPLFVTMRMRGFILIVSLRIFKGMKRKFNILLTSNSALKLFRKNRKKELNRSSKIIFDFFGQEIENFSERKSKSNPKTNLV